MMFAADLRKSLLATCAAIMASVSPSAMADPNFDACVITNMAAIHMLEDDIAATKEFFIRADLTAEAYEALQQSLAVQRATIVDLLTLRSILLRDERLDAAEQGARNATLMRAYANGAKMTLTAARENNETAEDLAAKATSCAESFRQ